MRVLIATAEYMPSEKLEWQAMGKARTALDIVQECAAVNARWSLMLPIREWVEWDADKYREHIKDMDTLEKAVEGLRRDTQLFVDAVLRIRDEELNDPVKLPWGNYSLADCTMHALWHMSYHEGQLNYIQLLYGDDSDD